MKSKKVAVLMGGWSSERDISLMTGAAIYDALRNLGWNVISVDVDRNIAEVLKKEAIDVAYIALHGNFGEDGTIQGLLEIMDIPYTGSDVLASALAMNKMMSKRILSALNLPTPLYWIEDDPAVSILEECCIPPLEFPLIVKPNSGGSTIGTNIVRSKDDYDFALNEAFKYDSHVLVEKYIDGREVAVGVLGNEALPAIEIKPKSGFYDYKAKYTAGETEYLIPTTLDCKLCERVEELALLTYRGIGCNGVARVDFRIDQNNNPMILEINTIPGMTRTSLIPKAALYKGIDFKELVERVLMMAINK